MKSLPELIRQAFAEKVRPIELHILTGGCTDHAAYLAAVAERRAFMEGGQLAIDAIQNQEEDDDYE